MPITINTKVNEISPIPYLIGPIAICVAIFLAAWGAHQAHLNGLWALVAGVAAVITIIIVRLITENNALTLGFASALQLLCAAYFGIWGAFAIWIGPTQGTIFKFWIGAAILLGLPTTIATWHENRYHTTWDHGPATGPKTSLLPWIRTSPWVQHLAELTNKTDWTLEKELAWPGGTGLSLHLGLPEGITRKDVTNLTERLAAKADLADGCAIEVRPAGSQKRIILDIPTKDGFATINYYTPRRAPKTFNQPLEIGVFRNCEPTQFMLRDTTGLCVGQTGGGKTNTLQVIAAEAISCNDTVVWMIDLNGSGISHPWINASPDRPVVDWVASTADEAEKMLEAAAAIIIARKNAYQSKMLEVNDDKIPISPDLPALVIIMDEGAEALSSRASSPRVSQLLDKIVSTGRASRVVCFVSTLRATGEMLGSTNTKAQVGVRIGLKTEQPEELNHLFGWDRKVTHADMPHVGCGLIKTKEMNSVRAFRSFRIEPSHYKTVAQTARNWRPVLDGPSQTAAGAAYQNRWTQTGLDQPPSHADQSRTGLDDLLTRIRAGASPTHDGAQPAPANNERAWAQTPTPTDCDDQPANATHQTVAKETNTGPGAKIFQFPKTPALQEKGPTQYVSAAMPLDVRTWLSTQEDLLKTKGADLYERYQTYSAIHQIEPVSRATFYRRHKQAIDDYLDKQSQSQSQSH